MVQANMPGRVPPKAKTIDVEVNLLTERIQERQRLLDGFTKRVLAGAIVFMFTIVSLPAAFKLQAKLSDRSKSAQTAAAVASKSLKEHQEVLSTAQPVVLETQMLDRVRSYSGNLIQGVEKFLNASGERMAFSTIKVEVIGGDLKVSGRADAEAYGVARDFVGKLAKLTGAKQVTLKKWRQNPDFAADGVTFEVEHIAAVGAGKEAKP